MQINSEVILKAAGGDIASFEEIYKAASGFVYNVALRVVGNAADAADITQDVFVKVYRNLRCFEQRSSLKTWLYRVTVNAALNHRKSMAKYTRSRADYDDALEYEDPKENIKDMLDRKEREKKLQALLDRLDPDQRACIVLREIEGLDYNEISEALGVKLNTVRTRLKRAREKLIQLAGVAKKG